MLHGLAPLPALATTGSLAAFAAMAALLVTDRRLRCTMLMRLHLMQAQQAAVMVDEAAAEHPLDGAPAVPVDQRATPDEPDAAGAAFLYETANHDPDDSRTPAAQAV